MLKKTIKKAIGLIKSREMVPIMVPTDRDKVLAGKTALVTGGGSGIGLAIAQALSDSGCQVVIAGTNEDKLRAACEKNGGVFRYAVLDVRDVSQIPAGIQQAAGLFDADRIDILVNCAGVHHTQRFGAVEEEEYDRIMDTNVKGTFFLCQAMGQFMRERGVKGHILNISSSSALRPAWGPYQMSKWAIRGLTLGLAEQLRPYGIVVNAIAPGQTATPMLGKTEHDSIYNAYAVSGRYIVPAEIASLAVLMVSDMGNMIVGDTVYMTGGSGLITYDG